MFKRNGFDMTQDFCCSCDGKLKKGMTDFIVRAGDDIIIITKVPALICEDCGEKYYTPEISRKIDVVMKNYFDRKRSCVEDKQSELSFHTVNAIQIELPA